MPKREKPGRKELEDHQPGATKEEVLATLRRVARTPKPQDEENDSTQKPEK